MSNHRGQPLSERGTLRDKIGRLGIEEATAESVARRHVEWEQLDLDALRGGWRTEPELGGLGGEGRGWVGRSECVHDCRCEGVGEDVELGDGSDVSGPVDGTAHDSDLLGLDEGLGVLAGCKGKVGQGSEGDNGDGVRLVVTENTEDLLVRRVLGWREEVVVLVEILSGLALGGCSTILSGPGGVEGMLPSFCGVQMWVLARISV